MSSAGIPGPFIQVPNLLTFMILEPIGSKSPSFSSVSKLAWFEIPTVQDYALTCPAQGFPVPLFR